MESKGKFHELILGLLKAASGILQIFIGSKMQYTEAHSLDNDLDIPYKSWVIGLLGGGGPKSILTPDQSEVLEDGGNFYLDVPELTDESIWSASYTPDGGAPVYIDKSMLQDGKLYSFPDPATDTFTIKIVFI